MKLNRREDTHTDILVLLQNPWVPMIPKKLVYCLVGNLHMDLFFVSRQLSTKIKTMKYSLPMVSKLHFILAMLSTICCSNCYCSTKLGNQVSASKQNNGTARAKIKSDCLYKVQSAWVDTRLLHTSTSVYFSQYTSEEQLRNKEPRLQSS